MLSSLACCLLDLLWSRLLLTSCLLLSSLGGLLGLLLLLRPKNLSVLVGTCCRCHQTIHGVLPYASRSGVHSMPLALDNYFAQMFHGKSLDMLLAQAWMLQSILSFEFLKPKHCW